MGRGTAPGAAEVTYSALPVRLAPDSQELRYLHVRQHRAEAGASSDAVAAAQRTLFVAVIPASYGLGGLRELLSRFGQVVQCSQLTLASLPAPAAHVQFSSSKAVKRVLEAAAPGAEAQEPPAAESCDDACGLSKWLADHRGARPGLEVVQKQVDDWIAAHEQEEAAAEAAAAAAAAGDDGWTVVGAKRGRHKSTDGIIAVGGVAPKRAAAQHASAPGMPVHDGFYRFQKRDKQRSEVLALREKFEADKARIAELRRQRAFKPS